ncbi:MAG TPA: hypothetical protein PLO89_09485, partial [Spirochaetota bacterium]|nr:hypothetical protein [Spirochaetota bacterium]
TPSISTNPPLSKNIENQLIIGWSKKAPTIIDEYCKYLIEGSNIIVICENITEDIKTIFDDIQKRNSGIKLRLLNMDLHNFENIEKIKPEQFDNIILLAQDGGDAELRDSETVSSLLEFRRYFKKLNKKSLKTQLITEVADSENIEIIQNAGVKDFLISNQFVSKIYAQCSEEPDVLKIYDDLFSPEGSEVYIKPADLFFANLPDQTTFGEICAAALSRNETCFGVKIKKYEDDRDANYGIYINPDKNQKFEITKEDALITLAEDET